MGDAALPQPTAGGFVPMLGVGMVGPVPGTVAGPMSSTRGSAVPQLHNAIVERLRARIELCRRHHSNCESRYQRGQAENSDREHESTLHLLNIVNQGPGHRKTKGNKGAPHQPSEYNSRVNGDQKSLNAAGSDPKNSTRIALQGSLRRKIEGGPPGYNTKQNGGGPFGPDLKRVRVEGGAMGHAGCAFSNGQSRSLPAEAPMSHGLQRKDGNMMPPPIGGELFSLTLKEMKKEPGEVYSCGQSQPMDPSMMVFEFKEEGDGQIDPELQDLFDELTKTVPSLNDLELERILKQDDAFGLDLGRPSSAGAGQPCGQLDRVIKTEYSPGYGQPPSGGSPHLRPASAGPALSMPPAALTTSSSSPVTTATQNPGQGSQGSSGASRLLPGWTEVSHAEQLKQIAANQQQSPAAALLHHHQNQAGAAATWSPAMNTHSSPGPFCPEKIPSPATLCAQRVSPQGSVLPPMSAGQSKGLSNCLFKPNGGDMKVHGSKPLTHFSHKPQIPLMGAPQNKPPALHYQQQQKPQQPPPQPLNPATVPNQHQPPQHFHSPAMPPCQQPKPLPPKMPLNQLGPGLHFKLQQRQVLPSGVRLPTSSSFGSGPGQSLPQQAPPALSNQPKALGKNQAMQRQLALQQHIINDSDKINPQDQLSRHLTRPPPDYKQPRRNMVGVQQTNPYKGGGLPLGMNSSQALTSTVSSQSVLQANPCQLPPGQGPKMIPSPNDRRFASRPDPAQGGYNVQTAVNQLQQHGNQNPIGLNQSSPRFPGPRNSLGGAFGSGPGSNGPHMRATGRQEGIPRQRLGSMLTGPNVAAPPNWAQGSKQPPPMGLRRFPGPIPPHPGGQTNLGPHHFPPRSMAPPNQLAPDTPMLPLNHPMNGQGAGPGGGPSRGPAPRPAQPRMPPVPAVAGLNQSSPTQPAPMGPFGATSQSARSSYQSGDLTFDFLQDGDNTVPGINSDSDFIDSLLKSGPGTDDWMKDINLDEILGGHS